MQINITDHNANKEFGDWIFDSIEENLKKQFPYLEFKTIQKHPFIGTIDVPKEHQSPLSLLKIYNELLNIDRDNYTRFNYEDIVIIE